MDNNNFSSNGIDLNPDMMTTQTGVPSVAAPATNTPSEPVGIIDITPGAPQVNISPTVQHIDTASLPEPKIANLTPPAPTDGLTHLADLTPPAEQPLPTTPPSPTPPSLPILETLATPEPVVPPVLPVGTSTPVSPLAEDPDLVKTAQ